jgi:ABC-2 type transport system permease protein
MKRTNTFSVVLKVVIAIAITLVLFWLSELKYVRLDMTEEGRYTLSESTKKVLENLDDTIRVTVYLDGDLPTSFSKMQREVIDLLNEFQQVAGKKHFLIKSINPETIGDANNFKHTISRLHDSYGLTPYTIQEQDENGKMEQRYVIPGMIVSTSEKFVTVNMLSNAMGNSPEEQINQALQDIEYQCVKAIQQLTAKKRKNIAFLSSQGEIPLLYCYNATVSLLDLYNVDRVSSAELLDSLTKYDALIVAQPTKPFTEQDNYVLDQYIMNNGNLLYMSDNVWASMDSLKTSSFTYALPKDLNTSDLLFNLGVRINPTVLLDNQCANIPMNVAAVGEQARFAPVPWYYFPLMKPSKESHLITKNIDVVKSEFASTIDTLQGNGNVKKTVLLSSSAYARVLMTPNTVGFQVLQTNPDKNFFNKYYVPTAVLLEGNYNSLYTSRKSPLENADTSYKTPKNFSFQKQSSHNRVIVVSDGDIIRNEIEVTNGDTVPKPLYYYKYFSFDKRAYTGNLNFFINAVSYLCGDSDLLSIRSREITIRLLNKNRIVEEKFYWQLGNILMPIVLIIFVGIVIFFVRKQKYSSKYVG